MSNVENSLILLNFPYLFGSMDSYKQRIPHQYSAKHSMIHVPQWRTCAICFCSESHNITGNQNFPNLCHKLGVFKETISSRRKVYIHHTLPKPTSEWDARVGDFYTYAYRVDSVAEAQWSNVKSRAFADIFLIREMAMTRSMTKNQNHDAPSRKRFKASDLGGYAPWSDINHDVLFLIIMQLGIVDFLAFCGVCKSWRECALSNRNRFMASRQPMCVYMSTAARKACYLDDFRGRKFKTSLPTSTVRICVGLTSGYLILFGKRNRDFLLVNPITRHQLHFPVYPFYVGTDPSKIRAILVYSPSLSGWVLLITLRFSTTISFSLAGERACWRHLVCRFPICDIHAFKGKIYILDVNSLLFEIRINQTPALIPLEIKNPPRSLLLHPEFVSSAENIYVMGSLSGNLFLVQEVDFDNKKWSYPKNTIWEYTLFLGESKCSAAIKAANWDDSQKQFDRSAYLYGGHDTSRKESFTGHMWYFPHDCFNVNLLEE